MMDVTTLVPGPPDWSVRWDPIESAFPEVAALRDTPHDPIYHAEGCPLTHTILVCQAMAASEAYRNLDEEERNVAFLTAILHDVAKPVTARREADRVSHPGHSRVGAIMARNALWRLGVEPVLRERVCSAISGHQVPFWLFERDWQDMRRFIIGASLTCGNEILAIQAMSDARGRVAPDVAAMIERVEFYRLAAEDTGCIEAPFPVADGTTLRAYMASPATVDPAYPLPRPRTRPVVTLMSGLPGTGKTTWLERNLPSVPIVSLDRIRDQLGVDPAKKQGEVVVFAKELARDFLRTGSDFAWDGTNISKDVRGAVLGLCRAYGYATRIVVTEALPGEILSRFSARGRGLRPEVMERMLRRWEYPLPWEADEVIGQGFIPLPSPPAEPNPFTKI